MDDPVAVPTQLRLKPISSHSLVVSSQVRATIGGQTKRPRSFLRRSVPGSLFGGPTTPPAPGHSNISHAPKPVRQPARSVGDFPLACMLALLHIDGAWGNLTVRPGSAEFI